MSSQLQPRMMWPVQCGHIVRPIIEDGVEVGVELCILSPGHIQEQHVSAHKPKESQECHLSNTKQ